MSYSEKQKQKTHKKQKQQTNTKNKKGGGGPPIFKIPFLGGLSIVYLNFLTLILPVSKFLIRGGGGGCKDYIVSASQIPKSYFMRW
jgi:hypothetical protein